MVTLALAAASLLAARAEAASAVAMRTGAAAADFHGELSHERARPSYFVGARYAPVSEEGGSSTWAGLGFDVLSSSVHQRHDAFPYETDQRLDVLAFLVLPHVCHGTDGLALCGGIGLGTVNVNSPANRQDYGTWHYEASARLPLAALGRDGTGRAAWNAELVAKYVGKVEQRVEERDAAFWLIAYGLGVGRSF
jgi:hypothetical protein